jgi:hypothetical protein
MEHVLYNTEQERYHIIRAEMNTKNQYSNIRDYTILFVFEYSSMLYKCSIFIIKHF